MAECQDKQTTEMLLAQNSISNLGDTKLQTKRKKTRKRL
jgi:hypothetical protein